MRYLSVLTLLAFTTLGYAFPQPDVVTGDTRQVSSPSMCKDDSGKYFVFSGGVGLEIRTSSDRKNWTLIGKVWPGEAPSETNKFLGENRRLWAPDCSYHNGEFWLYYAASHTCKTGCKHSGIFLAKSSTGAPGEWTDEGLVTSSYKATTTILLIDGNKWYLNFGSFSTGIKSLNISTSSGLPLNNKLTPLATRTEDHGAMEASVIFKFKDFYYLFTSWDHCCRGVNSTYNIRVGRSTSPIGGYVDKSGVSLKKGVERLFLVPMMVFGPGGQDLMLDDDGPILVYHYSTPKGTFLGINRLDFSSGWPVVI